MTETSSRAHAEEFVDGLHIELQPSPLGRRLVAALIDMGLLSGLFFLLMIPVVFFGMMAIGIFSVVLAGMSSTVKLILGSIFVATLILGFLAAMHAYYIVYEFKKGATPGKKLLGLRVVSIDGKRLSKGQTVLREVGRGYIDNLFFFPALISILCTKRRQRVGDLLAGTMVVYSAASEARESFLYVGREDYLSLLGHLRPEPVPEQLRAQYLSFANQAYLLGLENQLHAQQQVWLGELRKRVPRADELGINDLTLLRFFAEYCFQTELEHAKTQREGKVTP